MKRSWFLGLALVVALASSLAAAPGGPEKGKDRQPDQEKSILGKAADGVKKGAKGTKQGVGKVAAAVAETTADGATTVGKGVAAGAKATVKGVNKGVEAVTP